MRHQPLAEWEKRRRFPTRRKDLAGQRFGRLVALTAEAVDQYGYIMWRCVCDCGDSSLVSSGNLASGGVRSCGCSRRRPAG